MHTKYVMALICLMFFNAKMQPMDDQTQYNIDDPFPTSPTDQLPTRGRLHMPHLTQEGKRKSKKERAEGKIKKAFKKALNTIPAPSADPVLEQIAQDAWDKYLLPLITDNEPYVSFFADTQEAKNQLNELCIHVLDRMITRNVKHPKNADLAAMNDAILIYNYFATQIFDVPIESLRPLLTSLPLSSVPKNEILDDIVNKLLIASAETEEEWLQQHLARYVNENKITPEQGKDFSTKFWALLPKKLLPALYTERALHIDEQLFHQDETAHIPPLIPLPSSSPDVEVTVSATSPAQELSKEPEIPPLNNRQAMLLAHITGLLSEVYDEDNKFNEMLEARWQRLHEDVEKDKIALAFHWCAYVKNLEKNSPEQERAKKIYAKFWGAAPSTPAPAPTSPPLSPTHTHDWCPAFLHDAQSAIASTANDWQQKLADLTHKYQKKIQHAPERAQQLAIDLKKKIGEYARAAHQLQTHDQALVNERLEQITHALFGTGPTQPLIQEKPAPGGPLPPQELDEPQTHIPPPPSEPPTEPHHKKWRENFLRELVAAIVHKAQDWEQKLEDLTRKYAHKIAAEVKALPDQALALAEEIKNKVVEEIKAVTQEVKEDSAIVNQRLQQATGKLLGSVQSLPHHLPHPIDATTSWLKHTITKGIIISIVIVATPILAWFAYRYFKNADTQDEENDEHHHAHKKVRSKDRAAVIC